MKKQIAALLVCTLCIVINGATPGRSARIAGAQQEPTINTNYRSAMYPRSNGAPIAHEYMNDRGTYMKTHGYEGGNSPVSRAYEDRPYRAQGPRGLNTGVSSNKYMQRSGTSPLNPRFNAGVATGYTPGTPRLSPEANTGTGLPAVTG